MRFAKNYINLRVSCKWASGDRNGILNVKRGNSLNIKDWLIYKYSEYKHLL